MKCTDKQWMHCNVEKMGCEGCYYYENDEEVKILEDFKSRKVLYGKTYVIFVDELEKIQDSIDSILKERKTNKKKIKELEEDILAYKDFKDIMDTKIKNLKFLKGSDVVPKERIREFSNFLEEVRGFAMTGTEMKSKIQAELLGNVIKELKWRLLEEE